MITLALPDHARWASWLAAIDEFEDDELPGFSTFRYEVDDLHRPEVFAQWLAREIRQRDQGQDGFVPATVWWIVDDERPGVVLGSIHLRHELNQLLLDEGGHIGYGVRPSARGRGVAGAALTLCLAEAKARGIRRALLVCDATNAPSRRTIVAAGGVLEDTRGTAERYWIDLD